MLFQGSFVALTTPFNKDNSIDIQALKDLVQWQIEQGTDGLVCCGSTGEGISLSFQERLKVMETCVEQASGKIPIVAGIPTASTFETFQLTTEAKKLGVDAALIVVPYYLKPTDRGVVAHFEKINECGLDMIVYENPTRTGKSLDPETFQKLETIEHVKAIKASVDDDNFVEIKEQTTLPIFSGDDLLSIDHIELGAAGVISVIGNIVPKEWKAMVDYCLKGELDKGVLLYLKYQKLIKILGLEPNPQIVKLALHFLGKIKLVYRLPLLAPEMENQKQLMEELIDLKVLNKTLLGKE